MNVKTILGLTACALCAQAALSQEASAQEPDFDRTVIFAANSAAIGDRATIAGGDVVVNDLSEGALLGADSELEIGSEARIEGAIRADSVAIGSGAGVGGAVECNEGTGISCSGLSLPVFDDEALPVFLSAAVFSNAVDADVPIGATLILEEGSYADIRIDPGATLVFSGGTYDIGSITASGVHIDCAFPCRSLVFEAPAELRISGTFDCGDEAFVGASDGSSARASNVVLYVGGSNLEGADPSSLRAAASLGAGSLVEANVWTPNGTLHVGEGTIAIGAFLGLDVDVGNDADVALASAFDPLPTADAQEVSVGGTYPVSIELSGSDPEGDSLTFEIVTPPSQGTLSEITQQPPSGATITYTAELGYVPDSFVFRVLDPAGGFDEAVVSINPASDPDPDEPSNTVSGHDVSLAIVADTESVEITLSATADVADPETVDLVFSIETAAPSGGVLSGLTATSSSTATVLYTPDVGFEGSDRFAFEVCGDLDGNGTTLDAGECDDADVVVTVGVFGPAPSPPAPPRASDFTVTLQGDAAVGIDLAHQSVVAVSESGQLTATAPTFSGDDTITVDEGTWTFFQDCDLGVPCPAPAPFTFSTAGGACVSVTDAYLKGDQFEAFDNGTLLGRTSPPIPDDGVSEPDPDLAFADPSWSSGTFTVGAGSHSIDVQLTGSLAAPPTAGFLRVDSAGSAFCSGGEPDLVITSVTRDIGAPIVGTSVTFTAVVENVGTETAGASSVCFQVGVATCDGATFDLPSLEPGATFEITRAATLSIVGSFQNTAVADLDRVVEEASESNNTTVDTYTVTDPELVATIHVLPEHGSLLDSSDEVIVAVGITLGSATVTYVPGVEYVTSDSFEYWLTDPGTGLSSDHALVTLTAADPSDPCTFPNSPDCSP